MPTPIHGRSRGDRPMLPLLLLLLALGMVGSLLGARPASAAFQYQVYTGAFNVLPNFGTLSPTASGTTATIGTGVTGLADNFALVFTNTLQVPTTGVYEFYTNSDDGSKLYIDGVVVVDNDGLHAPRVAQEADSSRRAAMPCASSSSRRPAVR